MKEVLDQKNLCLRFWRKLLGKLLKKIGKALSVVLNLLTPFQFFQDIQRPLYLTAQAAIEYGLVDKIVDKSAKAIDEVLNTESWDKAAGLVKM